MSKKLLIAVLSLMFCTFAIVSADQGFVTFGEEGDRGRPEINPAATLEISKTSSIFDMPAGFSKPQVLEKTPVTPQTFWPPDAFCDFIDYSGGAYLDWWPLPYPTYGGNIVATSYYFDSEGEGYSCTLLTAYVGIDPTFPAYNTGTADLIVQVADGDRNVLGSVTVPNASLPTTAGYVTFDLSTIDAGNPLVFNDGESFRIYVTVSDPESDTIVITSDLGPVVDYSIWLDWYAGWYWWGPDDSPNLNIGVDVCCADIPYGECYRQNYEGVLTSGGFGYYQTPPPYGVTDFAMRISVDGPCTLTAVGVAVNDDPGVTPDLKVDVVGDASGFPNHFDIKFSTIIPYASIVWEPYPGVYPPLYNHIPVPTLPVVTGDFHVVYNAELTNAPGAYLWALSDGGGNPSNRATVSYGGSPVPLGVLYTGGDASLLIYADLCKDEFAVCKTFSNYVGANYWIGVPNASGSRRGAFQKFYPIGLGCRIEKVYYEFGDASYDYWGDGIGMYTYDCYMIIRDANTEELLTDSVLIPTSSWRHNMGGDYTLPPAVYAMDISASNVRFDAPTFVGFTCPDAVLGVDGVYILADDGSAATSTSYLYYPPDYVNTAVVFGPDFAINFGISIDVCCIPPPERDCEAYVGGDWPTAGHDFRRTGASWNTTGDARCKQTLIWEHHDAVDNFLYTRPVIYDGILVVAYYNKLQAFDIAASDIAGSSVLIWTIQNMPVIGTGMNNSVTVHNGYVYFGGGNAMSFNRADVYTGSDTDADGYGMDLDGSFNTIDPNAWTRNVLNGLGLEGNTTYTTSVILNDGSMDVLYVASEGGDLLAIDAATGLNYTGWVTANPVMLDGPVIGSLSSNGVDVLYVGTEAGTLYEVDALTGAIGWTVVAATDLDGSEFDHADDASAADSAVVTHEYFQGPVSVDMIFGPGDIYVRTSFKYPDEVPGAPSGARYRLDAGGNVIWSAPGRSYWQSGNGSVSSPVIDANMVLFQGIPTWTNGSRQVFSYNKESGTQLWSSDADFSARAFLEGALDCRMLEADLYYHVNNGGKFLALETDEGMVEFDYTYDAVTSNAGSGVAIDATHVIFTNYDGSIYCFMEGTEDIARLRILKTDELISVPFFSPDPFPVIYEDVFMNAGCANLTGTLEANEPDPSAIIVSSVNPNRMNRMMSIADQMITNSYHSMTKTVALDMNGYTDFDGSAYSKDSYSNMAAYAPPAWLNEIVNADFDLIDGAYHSVEYSVNGPLVTRGPHRCYVTIRSSVNYFINNPAAAPVIQLGVLGGCLEAGGDLTFGETSQNVVYFDNTGEFSNQDQTHMEIDGNSAAYWQGGMVVATSQYGLSFSLESWQGGDPADFWNTLLPEINCFDQCEPAIDGPVTLGYMWDGSAYAPVEGYYAASAFIDSALDYACDDGVTWDWTATDCPFSNDLTVGLHFDEYAYGVIGNAELNNVVIYRVDVTNRNSVAIEDEVFFGNLSDWDLQSNGSDVFFMDAAHSIMWGYSCAAVDIEEPVPEDTLTWIYGYGKIPMGMGDTRVRTLDANQAMWTAEHVALDSLYFYMSDPAYAGVTYQSGTDPSTCMPDDDREAYFTFTSNTFAAEEVFSFGYYVFGFNAADPRKTDKFTDLAKLVNAWAGFNRGDIDMDGMITLADNTALYNMVYKGGQGPLFKHTADVDNTDDLQEVNGADVQRLADYWWRGVALDEGWILLNPCPVTP